MCGCQSDRSPYLDLAEGSNSSFELMGSFHNTQLRDLSDWHRINGIRLQYPNMGICLADNHATWFGFYPRYAISLNKMSSTAMCTIFFIVVTQHIQRCVDYYSLIKCWCHHTILGHIYDVKSFQTIVMS